MEEYGPPPELDAEVLSSSCEAEKLIPRVEPLVKGYEAWIERCAGQAAEFGEAERNFAEELLEEARQLLDRMKRGLDLLRKDPDARLAFCFANRAMWLQASWNKP